MWNVNELIVLSDLHLAAERDTGSFQSDRQLAECLHWILSETQDSVTVLAGDSFDFLVAEHCISSNGFERFSCQTRQIIEHHPEVFDGLAKLVHSPRHQLVIMGGDHDSELVFPNVQETLERRLGIGLLSPAIRWLVQEEAFRVKVGSAITVVEHGHALDPWNRIDYASLHEVLSLCTRNLFDIDNYKQSPGSRLNTTVIRALRSRYEWINCLKPYDELVLPLLWSVVDSEGQQEPIRRLAEEYLSNKEFALNKKRSNSHNQAVQYRGEKEAEQLPTDEIFERWNRAIHRGPEDSENNDNPNDALLGETRLLSGRDPFFDVDQTDDSTKYLQPIFENGAHLVIHGHTHSAKALAEEGGIYINAGAWTQMLGLPASSEPNSVWRQFLNRLRTNEVETFCRPTFAHIQHQPSKNVTTATLFEWRHSSPTILATHSVANNSPLPKGDTSRDSTVDR